MGLLDWLVDRLDDGSEADAGDKTEARFTDDQMARVLSKFRDIVRLPDAQARDQLNRALTAIVDAVTPRIVMRGRTTDDRDESDEPSEWDVKIGEREMSRLEAAVETLRAKIRGGNPSAITPWDASAVENSLASLESYLSTDMANYLRARLDSARTEVPKLAAEARYLASMNAIQDAAHTAIGSVSTAGRLRTQLREAEEMLQRLQRLGGAERKELRAVRLRLARYRADKRLDQAAVARAGGNVKKADRMEREAAVMLAQDWPDCFPDEPAPPLVPPGPGV
jgi:hypothetical protein